MRSIDTESSMVLSSLDLVGRFIYLDIASITNKLILLSVDDFISNVLQKCKNKCPSIRKLVDGTIPRTSKPDQALISLQEAIVRFAYFLKDLSPDLDSMDPVKFKKYWDQANCKDSDGFLSSYTHLYTRLLSEALESPLEGRLPTNRWNYGSDCRQISIDPETIPMKALQKAYCRLANMGDSCDVNSLTAALQAVTVH